MAAAAHQVLLAAAIDGDRVDPEPAITAADIASLVPSGDHPCHQDGTSCVTRRGAPPATGSTRMQDWPVVGGIADHQPASVRRDAMVVVALNRMAGVDLQQFGRPERHPEHPALAIDDQRRAVRRPVRRLDQPVGGKHRFNGPGSQIINAEPAAHYVSIAI